MISVDKTTWREMMGNTKRGQSYKSCGVRSGLWDGALLCCSTQMQYKHSQRCLLKKKKKKTMISHTITCKVEMRCLNPGWPGHTLLSELQPRCLQEQPALSSPSVSPILPLCPPNPPKSPHPEQPFPLLCLLL